MQNVKHTEMESSIFNALLLEIFHLNCVIQIAFVWDYLKFHILVTRVLSYHINDSLFSQYWDKQLKIKEWILNICFYNAVFLFHCELHAISTEETTTSQPTINTTFIPFTHKCVVYFACTFWGLWVRNDTS